MSDYDTLSFSFFNSSAYANPALLPERSDQSTLTWTNVTIGLAFILFDVGVSTVFRLGIGVSLLIAALRCIGQLAVVATMLQQVFENKNPWLVALISCELAFTSSSNMCLTSCVVILNLLGTFETGLFSELAVGEQY